MSNSRLGLIPEKRGMASRAPRDGIKTLQRDQSLRYCQELNSQVTINLLDKGKFNFKTRPDPWKKGDGIKSPQGFKTRPDPWKKGDGIKSPQGGPQEPSGNSRPQVDSGLLYQLASMCHHVQGDSSS